MKGRVPLHYRPDEGRRLCFRRQASTYPFSVSEAIAGPATHRGTVNRGFIGLINCLSPCHSTILGRHKWGYKWVIHIVTMPFNNPWGQEIGLQVGS